jgi:hypothetical protein
MKIIIIFISIFVTNISVAQVFIKVKNLMGEGLSYSTITGNDNEVIICNDKGLANIESIMSQPFIVSNIGYEKKEIISIKYLQKYKDTLIVELIKITKNEPDVTITASTKLEVFGKVKHNKFYSYVSSSVMRAVRIENANAYQKILSVFIHIANGKPINNKIFRIRVFIEDSTGRPGEELTKENIIFDQYRLGKWNEFDISKYNIVVKSKSFYIGLQSFSNEIVYSKNNVIDNSLLFSFSKKSNISNNYQFSEKNGWQLYNVYDIKDKKSFVNPAIYVKSKVPN